MPDQLHNIGVNDLLLLRRLNSAVRAELNSLRWVSFRWQRQRLQLYWRKPTQGHTTTWIRATD
jgi:hypothetical protein